MISIVVPVYNTEKYIVDTIESVLRQSSPEWELLLIDDGSNDKSGDICKKYGEIDKRVRYYYQNNQGVSVARNNGIEHSIGEFILFLDSDDLLKENAVEILTRTLKSKIVDLICYNVDTLIQTKEKMDIPDISISEFFEIKDASAFLLSRFLNQQILFSIWNKVYSKNILIENNIRFTKGMKIGEDYFFNINYLLHTRSVVGIHDRLYVYREREGSAMSTYVKENWYIDEYCEMIKSIEYELQSVVKKKHEVNAIILKIFDNRMSGMQMQKEEDISYLKGMKNRDIWKHYLQKCHNDIFAYRKAFGIKNMLEKRKFYNGFVRKVMK